MTFEEVNLSGVWSVLLDAREDERGSLTKVYDRGIFTERGLQESWEQSLFTRTIEKGTIRGMHWQAEPMPETKLIRCSRGRVFDVLVDIRPDSPTCGQWQSFELSEEVNRILYAPAGVAHGFQTLEKDSELTYLISCDYQGDLQRGFRWDDSEVGIEWPLPCESVSERDEKFPSLRQALRQDN